KLVEHASLSGEWVEELGCEADDVRVVTVETADDQDLPGRQSHRRTVGARCREHAGGLPREDLGRRRPRARDENDGREQEEGEPRRREPLQFDAPLPRRTYLACSVALPTDTPCAENHATPSWTRSNLIVYVPAGGVFTTASTVTDCPGATPAGRSVRTPSHTTTAPPWK